MGYTPTTYTDFKGSVRAATTGNINLSSPGASIDGVTLAVGNRVLVKDQTTGSQNGVYQWNGSTVAMTRTTDADQASELTAGAQTFVAEGTANGNTLWFLTTDDPITLGTTALTFAQVGGVSSFGGLNDVTITSPADGQLLRYESTGGQWENTANAVLSDAGQLQVPTTGSSGGLLLGGDANLYRAAANNLKTDDTFDALLFRSVRALATDSAYRAQVTGDSNARLEIRNDGLLNWGAGGVSSPDTRLFRASANILSLGTDDKIQQATLPTTADDLTNQVYVDRMDMFYA